MEDLKKLLAAMLDETSFDPERWQRASQLVTHELLRDAGFTLPPDAEGWEGLSVEQAYDRLPEPEDGDECQRRSKSTPLAGVKMHHLMRFSPALAVVPVVHRRDPRCFV